MAVLKVYDFLEAGNILPLILEDDKCYCTHNSNGEDTLSFELQRQSENYKYIQEEVKIIGFNNRFVVKKLEEQSDFVIVTCDLDFSDWLTNIFVDFRETNITLPNVLNLILPTGWIVSYGLGVDITKHTTVEYQEGSAFRAATAKTILGSISEAYGVVFNFDMINNELKVLNMNAFLPTGEFFMEDLNISNLKFIGDSSGLVTRLYVYGKKDEETEEYITIASVNDGKEYLEDFTYTDQIISDSVVDERYTDPQNLKNYGLSILSDLCVPKRSYSFDVMNLSGEMYLYKIITLVDKRRKLRVNHQCIKYIEYNDKSLDKVTLSSTAPSIELLVGSTVSKQSTINNRVELMSDTMQSMESLLLGTDGKFKWILNSSGEKSEFLILVDSDSIGTATRLFKLNNFGLHYSSDGYNGNYKTLINQSGQFVGVESQLASIDYSVTTVSNSNVSPWGAVVEIDLSQDIASYGIPISIVPKTLLSSNPISAIMVGNNLCVYSAVADTNIPIKVTYRKSIT